MIHLVQIGNGKARRVALVEEPKLRCLEGMDSICELAQRFIRDGSKMTEQASAMASGELLDYEAIYAGRSEWKLLADRRARRSVAADGLGHGADAPGKREGAAGDAPCRSCQG